MSREQQPPSGARRRAVESFLQRAFADEDGEGLAPLEHYLKDAEGHEEAVAAAYRSLVRPEEGRRLPAAGERVGPYRLLRLLGQGGQGTVHLAEDPRRTEPVALKLLAPAGPLDEAARRRFRREAELAAQLEHPALCRVLDVDPDADPPYLVMESVQGFTLSELLRARASELPPASEELAALLPRCRDWGWIVLCFEILARGLEAAHARGVVHRDVKPGNVIITPDARPVLTDFGLARDLHGLEPTLTLTGDVLGTLPYMAPEQISGDVRHVDHRADLHALGVSLFETLTGQLPFDEPTPERMLRAILRSDPPRLSELRPDLPRALGTVLEVALERNPDRRFRSAADLADELARVRQRQSIHSRPAGPLRRVQRWARRNPTLAGVLLTVFLGLGLGLVLSLGLLDRVRAERDQKEQARQEVVRLADLALVRRLREEWPRLFPPAPARRAAMDDWLRRARAALGRRDEHLALLERVRSRARATRPEEAEDDPQRQALARKLKLAALEIEVLEGQRPVPVSLPPELRERRREAVEARIAQTRAELEDLQVQLDDHRRHLFDSDEDQWLHDDLVVLIDELDRLGGDDLHAETLRSVTRARARCEQLQEDSIDLHEEDWQRCIDDIADVEGNPRYGGLRLTPQFGLVPLGPCPDSGLHEFAHLLSGEPPERDEEGRWIVDEATGVILVLIPGGRFWQGAAPPSPSSPADAPNLDALARPAESPVVAVELDAFFLSKYELTQAQWSRLDGDNPSFIQPQSPEHVDEPCSPVHPVESVGWSQARAVLARAGLELPTVAQWEYAARADTSTPWWTGARPTSLRDAANLSDLSRRARMSHPDASFLPFEDGYAAHAPVGRYRANPFGLHDVLGNVREWCRDLWAQHLIPPEPGTGERLLGRIEYRDSRGGSFLGTASSARSTARRQTELTEQSPDLGLRPSRAIEQTDATR